MNPQQMPKEFGIFYPTGWIVVAFPKMEYAQQVQRDLLTGGYTDEDVRLVRCDEVVPVAKEQLQESGWLARLGTADEALAKHLEAAKRGSAFLLVYAPSDHEADRVMNVVRRVPFDFAHRYRRFAIQEMK